MTSTTPITPNVELFLNLVNRLSDAVGASVPPLINLDQLRLFPSGTLGHAWAESLDRHHLTPFTTGPRRKQLHDGVHLLTGYGTDLLGEVEVQAFLLGAKFRLAHLVLGLGLLRPIYRYQASSFSPLEVKQRLHRAYQRGRRSRFDVNAWQPEHQWHVPLAEVQAHYHL